MNTIKECMKSENVVRRLCEFMMLHCEDFPAHVKNYIECLAKLEEEVGTEAVEKLKKAINDKNASDIFFSAQLGYKANLDYFKNPVANNFLNSDPSVYLREELAMRMPMRERAQHEIDDFYAGLTDEQKAITEAITAYDSYLETIGPKLAHYYGFLFANEMLELTEPAYVQDASLTFAYSRWIEKYMNVSLLDLETFFHGKPISPTGPIEASGDLAANS